MINPLATLFAFLAPDTCLGCAQEGAWLCAGCMRALPNPPSRCFRCFRPSPHGLTCSACRPLCPINQLTVRADYAAPLARRLVHELKFNQAASAARDIASALIPPQNPSPQSLVVAVPTAPRRIRSRGYDQAVLIARQFARQQHLPRAAPLIRQSQTEQKQANRQQRYHQARQAFRLATIRLPANRPVILIDDVLTTGATLTAAAELLRAAGASQIDVLVFASA
jgi:ComF family protein